MLKKNYPYKSKVVLTEKQATKEPVGSYYHPTEKTFRSGACPVGMTLKKGYHRKGYMKMNGTLINNTNVDPVCVKNKGLPGKLIKKEKDDFKEFGYLTSSNNNSRFKSLLEACVVLSYGTVMRKLSALKKKSSKKEDNKSKKLYTIYSSDILMLQKWRIKNPDLYKVKTELLLVGGKKKVNDRELEKIIEDLINNISNGTRNPFFNSFQKLSNLDVSEITNTNNLFRDFDFDKAKELGYNVDISGWKLGNVESMDCMFYDSIGFNQNLSSWGKYLGKVITMVHMFQNCEMFEGKGLDSWGPCLDNVTNMSKMFHNCICFNQDLSSWGQHLGNVKDMYHMFENCEMFKGKGLDSWGGHLGNVTTMESMFKNCTNFNQNLSSWGPSLTNVTSMLSMFENCKMFEGKGLDSWGPHLGNVTNMKYMFKNCKSFNQNDLGNSWRTHLHKLESTTNIKIPTWYVSNPISYLTQENQNRYNSSFKLKL